MVRTASSSIQARSKGLPSKTTSRQTSSRRRSTNSSDKPLERTKELHQPLGKGRRSLRRPRCGHAAARPSSRIRHGDFDSLRRSALAALEGDPVVSDGTGGCIEQRLADALEPSAAASARRGRIVAGSLDPFWLEVSTSSAWSLPITALAPSSRRTAARSSSCRFLALRLGRDLGFGVGAVISTCIHAGWRPP
jgi:hypothetical protein